MVFGRLVKVFTKSGFRDHLTARRVQEEVDLHRLYTLTSFYNREGDGEVRVVTLTGVSGWLHGHGTHWLSSTAVFVPYAPYEGCRHSRGCQIGYMGTVLAVINWM
jgi:hypothetical protein